MSPENPQSTAIEQLEGLGLSKYAAETFVALASLGDGTAREVSEVSDVPRTRVYDAIEELQEQGLVDVQHSTPKQFWAISAETASRHFQRAYRNRVDDLYDALDEIESKTGTRKQRGVWTVTGRDAVTERLIDFVAKASDEVVFMSVGDLLDEGIIEALEAAAERGVDISLGEMDGETERAIYEEIPAAETFESLWDWSDTPAGRLLMVDRETTLVSVLVQNGSIGNPRDETAIWGSGEANGLVVVLKAVFTWQRGER